MVSYAAFFCLPDQTVVLFAQEDGIFETYGALFFLAASVFFFVSFINSKHGASSFLFGLQRNVFFLALALLFFLAFGEEISWGQRIFGLETPDVLQEANMQGELNLHNLDVFHLSRTDGTAMSLVHRVFQLFWFTYCVMIPAISRMSSRVSQWFEKISLPIVPLSIGVLFFINYVVPRVLTSHLTYEMARFLQEIKETNYALLFLVVSVWFFMNLRNKIRTQQLIQTPRSQY
jgi:hypothetical protein